MDNTAQEQKAEKLILAFVGMPGAGKSEAADYLATKGIPFIRFGDLTDETIKEMSLSLTPENERIVREKLRKDLGMAAYAIKAKPKIDALMQDNQVIGLNGLRSWEEYLYLRKIYKGLVIVAVYADAHVRHDRLAAREDRPVSLEQSAIRDSAELEKLNMGGPIAIADYVIENNSERLQPLQEKLDRLLAHLQIHRDD